MSVYHIPVLLQPSVEGLNINSKGVYVDLTYGSGGHSKEILKQLSTEGKLFSFDQDSDALPNVIEDPRFTFISENFKYLEKFLKLNGVKNVDGILADLGVSSHQFDKAERGFSFRFEAALDMRMNSDSKISAKDVINNYSEKQLADMFFYYGELNNARKLAAIIVEKRKVDPIVTTNDLLKIVEPWIKGKRNRYLAQLFQALRIEVNEELDALKKMLEQAVKILKKNGRLVVITYHSIEDRIVKNFMKAGNAEGLVEQDFFGNRTLPFKKVTRKPLLPDTMELKNNSRSRSAKLRIVEKQ